MGFSQNVYTPTYHASHALVVGIDQYQHLTRLNTAVHGAHTVATHLRDTLGFNVTEMYDEQPDRERILRWFAELKAHPDDRVIFYFAGHGVTQRIKNRSKGYLALANSSGYYNSLGMDEILDEAEALPAKHVLYLLDACFSGLALRGRAADFAINRTVEYLLTRPARFAITAGGDEVTDDDGAGEFSLFTHVLMEAFRDQALRADGMLRAKEIGLFIEERVAAHRQSRALPNHGYLQGSGDGDFLFSWETGARLPSDLEVALRSGVAEVRWGAVAALFDTARDPSNPEMALVARERLQGVVESDPDPRVRGAARSFFEEEEMLRQEADERLRREEADRRLEEARLQQEEAARRAREAEEELALAQRRAAEERQLQEVAEQDRQRALAEARRARQLTPAPKTVPLQTVEQPEATTLYEPIAEVKVQPVKPVRTRTRGWFVWVGVAALVVVIGVMAALLLLSPRLMFLGPVTFTVDSTEPWQNTRVLVQPGQIVAIEYVSGEWSLYPPDVPEGDASGHPDWGINTDPDFPLLNGTSSALIARVGSSDPQTVGNVNYLRADHWGMLSLQMNDDELADNSGSVKVRIAVFNPSSLSIYQDRLDDEKYEGKLNTDRFWVDETQNCRFKQDGGMLLYSEVLLDDSCSIGFKDVDLNFNQIRVLEARIKLSGNLANKDMIRGWAIESELGYPIFCGMDRNGYELATHGQAWDSPSDYFSGVEADVADNRWHTIRMTVNSTSFEVSCFVDNVLVGSTIPSQINTIATKPANVFFSTYSWPGVSGTTWLDDFYIASVPD